MEKHTDLGAKHQGSNWKGPFVAFAIVAFVGIGEVAEDVQRHMCGLESGKGPSGTCFCYASFVMILSRAIAAGIVGKLIGNIAQEIRLVQQSSDPDKRGEVRALGVLLFLLVSLFIGILLVTANVIEL